MIKQDKLVPRGTLLMEENLELYRLVDFLNRNLKEEGLLFGLSKMNENKEKMVFSYYKTS